MKNLRALFIVGVIGTALATEASAAPVCTRSDATALQTANRSLNRSIRNFENSPIRSFCSAGRKVLAEYHRYAKVIKARSKCTLATSRDRREWSQVQSLMAKAERDFRAGCR